MKNESKVFGLSALSTFIFSFLLTRIFIPEEILEEDYTAFQVAIREITGWLTLISLILFIIWLVKTVQNNHKISAATRSEKERIEREANLKAAEMQKRYRWLDPSEFSSIQYYDVVGKGLPGKLVVLDVETTGLYPDSHRIVEISLLTYEDGVRTDTFTSLVNPETPMPEDAMRIHGITDQIVMDKPKIHEIIHEISQRIAGNIVVGYNVRFDIGFIETALRRTDIIPGPWTAIDVLAVARTATEKISLPDKKLSTLKEYFSIGGDSHRSENDCAVTYEVLLKSLEMISKRDQEYKSIQADRLKRLNVKELSYLNELSKAFISADLESPEFEIMSNFVIALSYRGNLFGRVKLRGKDASIQFIGGDSKDTVAIAEDDNISIYTPRFIDTARAYNVKKKTSNNINL